MRNVQVQTHNQGLYLLELWFKGELRFILDKQNNKDTIVK